MTVWGPGAPKYTRQLRRRKPLKARPRSKGNRAEREVVDMLRAAGWTDAKRNWQSGGQGGGDVIEGPADTYLEIRHRETWAIPAWLAEVDAKRRPTDLGILAFRKNGTRWYAAVDLESLLEMLKVRDFGM